MVSTRTVEPPRPRLEACPWRPLNPGPESLHLRDENDSDGDFPERVDGDFPERVRGRACEALGTAFGTGAGLSGGYFYCSLCFLSERYTF